MDGVAEACLVLDQPFEAIEIAPGAVLDQRAPQIDDLLSRRRRGLAGQSLPHHERDRFLDGRIRPVGDLVELAAVETVVEHGREVLCNAGHPACADRLDAGLLDRLEYGARLLPARHELAMHERVMAGELERDRVGVPAHDRGIRAAELSRRLGQARLAADDPGAFRGEGDFELRLARDRAQAPRDRALERLGRGVFRRISGLDVR
jgi:hypothetical protein